MKIDEGAGGIESPGKPEDRPQMPINPDRTEELLSGFEQGVLETFQDLIRSPW